MLWNKRIDVPPSFSCSSQALALLPILSETRLGCSDLCPQVDFRFPSVSSAPPEYQGSSSNEVTLALLELMPGSRSLGTYKRYHYFAWIAKDTLFCFTFVSLFFCLASVCLSESFLRFSSKASLAPPPTEMSFFVFFFLVFETTFSMVTLVNVSVNDSLSYRIKCLFWTIMGQLGFISSFM